MNGVFQALADPTRRRILELLREGGMTAGDIAAHFEMSQPSVSHHLKLLKNAELVTAEREGQYIKYYLNLSVLEEALLGFYNMVKGAKV
ncbi:MAG: winged helix-turn-helix transcriptional regulator [Syntrophomonadaceae bacterium]|jgi:ArsR family transcriptional regulator|nr:winged helix-turn-helix transcriptional regulator [Syntrophomonadaceae bacterium]